MRKLALFSFALLPALAYGQATTATGTQTATPAADLQARATTPAFNHAEPASTAAAVTSHPLKNIVTLQAKNNANTEALRQGGSLSYTFAAGDENSNSSSTSPVLTHVVSVSVDHIASGNADVTVSMTVDQHGVPTNLKIARSAGAELDSKTLAAVSQYRFKPATFDRLPINADVSVDVKLTK